MASSKSLKILFLIEYFTPHIGGVERVVEEVGTKLAKRGYQVYVFTTEEEKNVGLFRVYSYKGMTIRRMQLPNFAKRYIFALLSLPFLFFWYRNVDIIHSANNYTVALPAWLFAKITGKKVTISVWEIWGKQWISLLPPIIGSLHWAYETLILSLPFDHYFVPSDYVLRQVKKSGVSLAPLGGKNLRFSWRERTKLRNRFRLGKQFVFLYYGRLGLTKGVDILIAAYDKFIRDARQKTHLFLIVPHDNSSLFQSLIAQVDTLHLHQLVTIVPSVSKKELASYLSFADCIVIPDLTIAFGLNALDVSQMGRPMVVSTGGALPEVSFGKVIFVQPGSVNDLILGMKRALKRNWDIIPKKHFSWNSTAQAYEEGFVIHTLPRS